jgi:hypothetical protein
LTLILRIIKIIIIIKILSHFLFSFLRIYCQHLSILLSVHMSRITIFNKPLYWNTLRKINSKILQQFSTRHTVAELR